MTLTRTNPKEEAFWWANILVPLSVGLFLYFILKSERALPYLVNRFFGADRVTVFGRPLMTEGGFKAVLLYGRDFLWSYSLMFALGYWSKDSLHSLYAAFAVGFAFETGIIIWQFFTVMGGAFDPGHLFGGIIGNILAILVILIQRRAVV